MLYQQVPVVRTTIVVPVVCAKGVYKNDKHRRDVLIYLRAANRDGVFHFIFLSVHRKTFTPCSRAVARTTCNNKGPLPSRGVQILWSLRVCVRLFVCAYACVRVFTCVRVFYDIRVFLVGGGHDRALSPDSFQGPLFPTCQYQIPP